ncbi:hypothetical protein T12_9429 [Trichinella patagoniensis]|uniref:Uncharacterized protein n=1 Tax=Trichinella patagoniensis TaxID=990121 RepID=A0A0V1ACH1_9BILA|nr:hypothetical protein T12_9429 [Trichinella patagoniensis]
MQILSSTFRTCISELNTIAYGGDGGVRAGLHVLWVVVICRLSSTVSTFDRVLINSYRDASRIVERIRLSRLAITNSNTVH